MIETVERASPTSVGSAIRSASRVGVILGNDRHSGAWDAFVDRHAEGTFFHGWSWRRAVHTTFGLRPFYLMAYRDDLVVGVLPLFLVRSVLAGRLLVSVPYAVYGGALVEDQQAADALLNKMRNLARDEGVRQVDLRSIREVWPELPTLQDRYVTFQKPLPDREEDVLAGLPRKARAAARNARDKYGLSVEFSDEHLRDVWRLYARSMRRLGSPNYPYKFFEALLSESRGHHVVSLVRHRSGPAAGLVSFVHRDTLMPYFAGCDERLERYGANNYLYLTAMEWGVRRGLRTFDFGRSRRANRGSYDFKRHQGFEPKPLSYQMLAMGDARPVDLTPDSKRLQWAVRTWRRLPLCVTRPLGGWVAKSIPG